MRVHFIAIGGSAMHNLAIALKLKGYEVSGSDDQIFDPSRSRLEKYDLLPAMMGWDANRITEDLDAIILGMHAREDNPELIQAQEMGLKIYSYPEYIFEQTKKKKRVVISGSHGKTTITSMILHVLQNTGRDVDYMVGAQLEGFECMVKLTDESKYVVLEGDEYLSSPIDRRPKFHLYKPHIALLSGIAWDHINVFPTFENYVDQFRIFLESIGQGGNIIWFEKDREIEKLIPALRDGVKNTPYKAHDHIVREGITYLLEEGQAFPIEVFGQHNLANIQGALEVCRAMGVKDQDFYEQIMTFKGASKRMEKLESGEDYLIMKDFAHSPSKLKATTQSVKEQFPNRRLVACMELHTFSSLNAEFLGEYKDAMQAADEAVVFFSKKALEHKKLPPISEEEVKAAFNQPELKVISEEDVVQRYLNNVDMRNTNLLLMSSGNFGGIDLAELASSLIEK